MKTGRKTAVPKITEAQFTRQVIQFARMNGWLCAHFRPGLTRRGQWRTPVQGDAGFPDLVMVRPGWPRSKAPELAPRVVVAELKVGKNRPSHAQVDWLAAFSAAGVLAALWMPESWDEIEAVLGRP